VHEAVLRSGKPYCAVRFGNVLCSRGSVVRTLKQQIASGGPVTVTHPATKRYFMTIPEAVQFVLHAAARSHWGEVLMLDMSESVEIVDMARDLIRLSAPQLRGDVEIVYTGLRPGEKLFEELLLSDEQYKRTVHEKIFIAASGNTHVPFWFDQLIDKLEQAGLRDNKEAIRVCLRSPVPEYSPDAALPGVPARIPVESYHQRASALEGVAK
jgi:FlaA1/EpsC-like NDP-sugar epimerase